MQKPRAPGSEAPNRKPLFTNRRTSVGHSKVPIAQATAGKLYRVRDKDWAAVWGENLTHAEAVKLKNKVVASRKSTTARLEDMEIPPPPGYEALSQEPENDGVPPTIAPLAYELANADEVLVPGAGVIRKIPPNHELLVNGVARPVPAAVAYSDVAQARPLDPEIAMAQAAALAAVRPLLAAPNQALGVAGRRAADQTYATYTVTGAPQPVKPRSPYRDVTATAPPKPNRNPPRDQTVSKEVFMRLEAPVSGPPSPPPSPLKVATIPDGQPLPDDALGEDDLSELAADIGGGASDADIEHARRQSGR